MGGRLAYSSARKDCVRAVEARAYQAGEVLIVRNEGPVGGPGMREMLGVTAIIYGQQMGEKVALVTDGRFSGATRGICVAMCRRRQRSAARSHWSATVIGCASILPTGAWTCSPATASWHRVVPYGARQCPVTKAGSSPNTQSSSGRPISAPSPMKAVPNGLGSIPEARGGVEPISVLISPSWPAFRLCADPWHAAAVRRQRRRQGRWRWRTPHCSKPAGSSPCDQPPVKAG